MRRPLSTKIRDSAAGWPTKPYLTKMNFRVPYPWPVLPRVGPFADTGRTVTTGRIPSLSRFLAVHSDSISTSHSFHPLGPSARSARNTIAHGVSRGKNSHRRGSPRSGRKKCLTSRKRLLRPRRGLGLVSVTVPHGLRRGLRSATPTRQERPRWGPRPPATRAELHRTLCHSCWIEDPNRKDKGPKDPTLGKISQGWGTLGIL